MHCFGDPKTPVLACSLYDAATGERVAFTKDYAVIEKAGLRIAVIGCTPDYSPSVITNQIAPYAIEANLDNLDALVREANAKEAPVATVIIVHDNPMEAAEAMDPAQVNLAAGTPTTSWRRPRRAGPPACKAINTPMASLPRRW